DKCTHDGTLFNSDSVHALDTSLANSLSFFYLITPRPPTSTLFPYTTLFRSISGGHAGHRNYVVCGCAVGNDNVQVRRAAVRRHCVGRSSLDGGDVPDERGNAERCAGLGPRKGAGCFSAGVYGLVGCRERVLGI